MPNLFPHYSHNSVSCQYCGSRIPLARLAGRVVRWTSSSGRSIISSAGLHCLIGGATFVVKRQSETTLGGELDSTGQFEV